MAFLTRQQFTVIAETKAGRKSLQNMLYEALAENRAEAVTSIFLSHCHTDVSIVEEAVSFFKGLRADVFVDWMIETMPEKPNGKTANILKEMMNKNDKFILLATNNAVRSRWCNWELGIGDTYKLNTDKLAIFPLADNRGDWVGNEYLQIYPRIEPSSQLDTGQSFEVIYPSGRSKLLSRWIMS
ncbi:MAG TPA: hypothetical protein VFA55_01345 [Candidatus Kapabacteria bacterium]|nr:hypothetical protein [Candidatus Kapabacteria bacterium]